MFGDQEFQINMDMGVLVSELVADQSFINAVCSSPTFINAVRNAILIDARRKGNSFGQWAQSTAPTSGTQRRLH
jgi:hypothetical protein